MANTEEIEKRLAQQQAQLAANAAQYAKFEAATKSDPGPLGVGGFGGTQSATPQQNMTVQQKVLQDLYKQSGVVFDSSGNVIYNPADLGSSNETFTKAALGLPVPKITGSPSQQYQQRLLDAGVSRSELDQIIKDRKAVQEASQKINSEIQAAQAKKEQLQNQISEIDRQIDQLNATIPPTRVIGIKRGFTLYNYAEQDAVRRSISKDVDKLLAQKLDIGQQIVGINASIDSLNKAKIGAEKQIKDLQQSENRATYERLFGARATVKSVMPPSENRPLKGTNITAAELKAARGDRLAQQQLAQKQLFQQVTQAPTALEGFKIQLGAQQRGEGTTQKYITPKGEVSPFADNGKAFFGKNADRIMKLKAAGNPPATSQGPPIFSQEFANSLFAPRGDPRRTTGFTPGNHQVPASVPMVTGLPSLAEPQPKTQSKTQPKTQQTVQQQPRLIKNHTLDLFESVRIGNSVSKAGSPPPAGTNYNIGIPKGPVLITDENKVVGVAGSLEQIYGSTVTKNTPLQQVKNAIKSFTVIPANRPPQSITQHVTESAEGLKAGAIRAGYGLAVTLPRALYAHIKEGEAGSSKVFEEDDRFLTKIAGPSALSEVLSGQPVSRGPSYAQAEIFMEVAPNIIFALAGLTSKPVAPKVSQTTVNLGKGIAKPPAQPSTSLGMITGKQPPKPPAPGTTEGFTSQTARLGTGIIGRQSIPKPGEFTSQKVNLGTGIAKPPAQPSTSLGMITGKQPPKPPPREPPTPGTEPVTKTKNGLELLLEPKQKVKTKPSATYVKLGEGEVKVVKIQKTVQKTEAEKITEKFFEEQRKMAKRRQELAVQRVLDYRAAVLGMNEETGTKPPEPITTTESEIKTRIKRPTKVKLPQPLVPPVTIPKLRHEFDYPPVTIPKLKHEFDWPPVTIPKTRHIFDHPPVTIPRHRFDWPTYRPPEPTLTPPPQKPPPPPPQEPPPARPRIIVGGPPLKPPFVPGGGGSFGRGQKRFAKTRFSVFDVSSVIPRGVYYGREYVSSSPALFTNFDKLEQKYLKKIEKQSRKKTKSKSTSLKLLGL
jgi:hypothetical protein